MLSIYVIYLFSIIYLLGWIQRIVFAECTACPYVNYQMPAFYARNSNQMGREEGTGNAQVWMSLI